MYEESGSVYTEILLLACEDEINYLFLSQRDSFLFSGDRSILAFSWNALQGKQKECFVGKSWTGNTRTNMLSWNCLFLLCKILKKIFLLLVSFVWAAVFSNWEKKPADSDNKQKNLYALQYAAEKASPRCFETWVVETRSLNCDWWEINTVFTYRCSQWNVTKLYHDRMTWIIM